MQYRSEEDHSGLCNTKVSCEVCLERVCAIVTDACNDDSDTYTATEMTLYHGAKPCVQTSGVLCRRHAKQHDDLGCDLFWDIIAAATAATVVTS